MDVGWGGDELDGNGLWLSRLDKQGAEKQKTIELWCTSTENSNDCINVMILQQLMVGCSTAATAASSLQNPGHVQQQVIDYNFMLS